VRPPASGSHGPAAATGTPAFSALDSFWLAAGAAGSGPAAVDFLAGVVTPGWPKVDGMGRTRHWDGGQILDPQDGDVYGCTMRLADGGDQLVVRGFLGLALLGRSQTWLRARG